MTVFENSFLGSFDMGHCGHINTWKTAEKEIGPTQIVVCMNDLKSERRLTPEQSRKELFKYLHDYTQW